MYLRTHFFLVNFALQRNSFELCKQSISLTALVQYKLFFRISRGNKEYVAFQFCVGIVS